MHSSKTFHYAHDNGEEEDEESPEECLGPPCEPEDLSLNTSQHFNEGNKIVKFYENVMCKILFLDIKNIPIFVDEMALDLKCDEDLDELDECTPAGYDKSNLNLHMPSNWKSIRDKWICKMSCSCKCSITIKWINMLA